MHNGILNWLVDIFLQYPEVINGKNVIEVGSKYVNGSASHLAKLLKPAKYVGTDISAGDCVDDVVPVENLVTTYGKNSFDTVISTEMLEHVFDWRMGIQNMKDIVKPGGFLIITTCAKGFPYHAYPYDFWRFSIEDFKKIFSDFDIISLKEIERCSVFILARKTQNIPADLSQIPIYSIASGKVTTNLVKLTFNRKMRLFFRTFSLIDEIR